MPYNVGGMIRFLNLKQKITMKLLETKEQLTLNELLRIAYEYGNDNADMPADSETVAEEFSEWIETTTPLFKKLIIPVVVGRSEQLRADLYRFRNMFCQNVDLSSIDEYVDELGS